MGFSKQEYWSGLPFPSPGDLPNPGIEPVSSASQADTLTSEPPGKLVCYWDKLHILHKETEAQQLHNILMVTQSGTLWNQDLNPSKFTWGWWWWGRFLHGSSSKESTYNAVEQNTWVQSLGQVEPLEEEMTTRSSILAWKISWTEEPARL